MLGSNGSSPISSILSLLESEPAFSESWSSSSCKGSVARLLNGG